MLLKRGALTLVVLCCLILNIIATDDAKKKADDTKTKADDGKAKVDEGKTNASDPKTNASDGKTKADGGNSKADEVKDVSGCGVSDAPSTHTASNIRIISAQEAEKGAWPWMADVYIKRKNRKQPACGGALISRSYVVTAAHCVVSRGERINAKNLSVRLGEHDQGSEKDGMKPVDVNVTSIDVHDEFDSKTFHNDIALLRLEHPANFSKHIRPLCLLDDSATENLEESGIGYVAGWGASSCDGDWSNVLTEMSAYVVSDDVCREAYEGEIDIADENICTVGVNDSSPCWGFGGGPLMLPGKDNRYYLAGIVSFAKDCGNLDFPDVYTRVSMFVDWIREHLT